MPFSRQTPIPRRPIKESAKEKEKEKERREEKKETLRRSSSFHVLMRRTQPGLMTAWSTYTLKLRAAALAGGCARGRNC